MINAHKLTAVTILLASCVLAPPAMAAGEPRTGSGTRYIGPGATADEVLVVERSKMVRPAANDLCQYKPVMTDEDMLRCGIGVSANPIAPTVLIVERRKPRKRQ